MTNTLTHSCFVAGRRRSRQPGCVAGAPRAAKRLAGEDRVPPGHAPPRLRRGLRPGAPDRGALRRLGIRREDRVATGAARQRRLRGDVLSDPANGAVAVPVNTFFHSDELRSSEEIAQAALVVSDESLRKKFRGRTVTPGPRRGAARPGDPRVPRQPGSPGHQRVRGDVRGYEEPAVGPLAPASRGRNAALRQVRPDPGPLEPPFRPRHRHPLAGAHP